MGYPMPKPFLKKNSSNGISTFVGFFNVYAKKNSSDTV